MSAVVDLNPCLQIHYISGMGISIIAPSDLVPAPPRTVLTMNPVDADEVRGLLDELGLRSTKIVTI